MPEWIYPLVAAWPGNIYGIRGNLPGLAVGFECLSPIHSDHPAAHQVLISQQTPQKNMQVSSAREGMTEKEKEVGGTAWNIPCNRAHSDNLSPSGTFCLCPDDNAIWHCAAEHEGLLARGICNPHGTVPQLPIYGRNIGVWLKLAGY